MIAVLSSLRFIVISPTPFFAHAHTFLLPSSLSALPFGLPRLFSLLF